MTSADALRKYLCENGFSIEKEVACTDSGKLYTVIKTTFTGEFSLMDEAFYRTGMLDPKDDIAKKYIEKQLKIVEKLIFDDEKMAQMQNNIATFAVQDTNTLIYNGVKKLVENKRK